MSIFEEYGAFKSDFRQYQEAGLAYAVSIVKRCSFNFCQRKHFVLMFLCRGLTIDVS